MTRCLSQAGVLIRDSRPIEHFFGVQHVLLAPLQEGVQPPYHRHRQNHVPILAANVQIPQHVIRDAPDEVGDPAELRLVHEWASAALLK